MNQITKSSKSLESTKSLECGAPEYSNNVLLMTRIAHLAELTDQISCHNHHHQKTSRMIGMKEFRRGLVMLMAVLRLLLSFKMD